MPKEFSRSSRVNTQLQRELSEVIRDELSDPRIGKVTVTQVVAAADMRSARVSVSMLEDDKTLAATVKLLNGAGGRLRHVLATRMRLRHMPELHFVADTALREGDRISGLIRAAIERDQQHPAADAAADEQAEAD